MREAPLRIFVLADTHNRLPKGLDALVAGADEIWHLGDVCAPGLADELAAYGKPFTLVRGNCDEDWGWPLSVDLERGGLRFHLVHIPPTRAPANTDVLLHGHTHVSRDEMKDGVGFLNPGCVTRPNRGAAPSIAFLEIFGDGKLTWRLQRLL